MGFELWKDPIQFAQFIVLIIFSPLGVILTVLRVMATRRSSRKVAFEDWMALVAAFFTVMTNVAGLAGTYLLLRVYLNVVIDNLSLTLAPYSSQHTQWPRYCYRSC